MSVTDKMRLAFYVAVSSLLLASTLQAHQGMPNVGASKACTGQSLGDVCEWSDAHNALYVGSCRKVTSSLLCVRNKPIVYPKDKSVEHNSTEH